MKRSTLLVSLALGSALAVAGALLAPSFAGEHRADPVAERQWLSIAQIHDKLQAAGYRNVEKIERERGGYEVRATDPKGERIKLYVNPRTGEIMHQRGDGKRIAGDGAEQQAARDRLERVGASVTRRKRENFAREDKPGTS